MKHYLPYLLFCALFPTYASANFVENTDITDYLNQLIKNQKSVSIPNGNYKIDANKAIRPQNGSEIKLSDKTVLNVIPNKNGSYRVFNIKNVSNVKISGGTLVGDKYSHLGTSGEWGMGIEIRDAQNIFISNINIDKMWGDAIYIGTSGKNSTHNINLNNIKMNDNRRQGLSIISVNKLIATKITASNTSGASPASGIDIEPNNGSTVIKDIILEDISTSNNAGAGIQIGLSRYANSTYPFNISIKRHTDKNSEYGILMGAINKNPAGSISMSSLNYKQSRSPSCFNSWTNNKVLVNISGPLEYSTVRACLGHQKSQSFRFN